MTGTTAHKPTCSMLRVGMGGRRRTRRTRVAPTCLLSAESCARVSRARSSARSLQRSAPLWAARRPPERQCRRVRSASPAGRRWRVSGSRRWRRRASSPCWRRRYLSRAPATSRSKRAGYPSSTTGSSTSTGRATGVWQHRRSSSSGSSTSSCARTLCHKGATWWRSSSRTRTWASLVLLPT